MNTEISRKLVHLIALLIPILYYFLPKQTSILILALFTLIFIVIDYIRLHIGSFKKLFLMLFGQLLRRKELYTLTGGSYLLIASLISMLVFSKEVFIPAILFLVIGDTVAALFGIRFGRIRLFRKTVAGTLSCLVVCLIIAYLVSKLPKDNLKLSIGIVGAVIATIVEALPVEVNDNVIIPISTGIVMQILKSIYV